MRSLFAIASVCLVSGAMAIGQGVLAAQSTGGNGTQPSAGAAPAAPSQALPGNANPGNAVARDGRANAQTVRPNQPSGGTPGTAAGNVRDNQAAPRDDSSTNPTKTRDANTPIPRGSETIPWLWLAVALGIVLGIALIAASLTRGRATDTEPMDSTLRTRRDDIDRNDRIRRAG